MSVGPLGGVAGSAAGSPLAQTKGADEQRVEQETAAQKRRIESDQKAEAAAGIGETDGDDHETAERDADGRRLWEQPPEEQENDEATEEDSASSEKPRSKDPSGQSGSLLDLSG